VVSKPRITPEGKAQADSKAQPTRQYVSISRGLQRRHRVSDGVMKPLLRAPRTDGRQAQGAMGNPKKFSFTLKNDISELKILCRQLESIGGALGLPQRFMFEINLALDELFTNIISYGFNDRSEHTIQVRIAADDGTLTITVEDDGVPFNPIERSEPRLPATIEDCNIGGLGIYLIKNLMDDIRYRRNRDKNVLTLKKRIETI
jgi:serine/threonine-protein kinase RsbW